ncbi:unnamed protein product [Rhizophagus irregularis]|nr:unnamed protein product [Rhizophagus irregularis]
MQQEFYSLFMRKCPELKYFDMKSIKHQIFYFPEAMIRLESLCELTCETSTDASYFYGLSLYCQYIQKLIIFNTDPKSYYGIVRLIEVQKNLKHFEWVDDFNDGHFTSDDHYEKVLLTLEKKAESLNYLKVFFEYMLNRDYEILQDVLSKFSKLKVLIIDALLYFEDEQVDKLQMQVYSELELLSMNNNRIDIIYSIIENSGSCLKEVLFRPYDAIDCDYEGFDENSLIFIRKIYENCPLIEYLSITFPSLEEHFAEFEKLLKICQNLKSLLLLIFSDIETNEEYLKNGEILLKILTRSASSNLKEIRICNGIKFSLENLEEFFEKWKGKHALSILTVDPIYLEEDYTKLINKYKSDGIIKDFKYVNHAELDNSYTL